MPQGGQPDKQRPQQAVSRGASGRAGRRGDLGWRGDDWRQLQRVARCNEVPANNHQEEDKDRSSAA